MLHAGRRLQIDTHRVLMVVAASLLACLLGARGYYLLNSHTALTPDNLFNLSGQGFALYGGLLGALLVGTLSARLLRVHLAPLADASAPWVGLGIVLVRLGCFLHGCCFGKVTDVPWGIHYHLFSPAHLSQLSQESGQLLNVHAVHPTQLYELAAALSASLVALYLNKRYRGTGIPALGFVLWFTCWRWLIFYLRDTSALDSEWWQLHQWQYSLVVLVCVCWIILLRTNIPCKRMCSYVIGKLNHALCA
jgi:phosphatidylglycerol:prolipoprotein diacylglycerol transferase